MFYFSRGELVEVELQYRTADWDEDKYNSFMGDVRKKLEQKYGASEQIARKEEPLGEIIQKVTGWKWNQNNTAIEASIFPRKMASTPSARSASTTKPADHAACYPGDSLAFAAPTSNT